MTGSPGTSPATSPGTAPGTPSGLAIRRATTADWPRIWPIWHDVVRTGDTYCYDPDTDSDTARVMWIERSGVLCWLAEVADRVVGVYEISPNHDGPGAHVANGSYMVDAAVRGRGVGRALVEHSLQAARAAGFLAIQFNAVAETNVGAISLYTDLGFTTVGIVPGAFRHPVEGLVDLRIMHHDLRVR
ncbi:MAG: GNAT family N-acetyltransferase [bacterium]